MKLTTKQILTIVVIVIVIIITIAIWFYYKGKHTTIIAPVPLDVPGSTDPNNNAGGLSDNDINTLVQALYADMSGITVWRNDAIYEQLSSLSNTDFVKVYNAFNVKYDNDNTGQTLKGWIDGEYGIGEFSTAQSNIDNRFAALNLI